MADQDEEEVKDPEEIVRDVQALGRQLEKITETPSPKRIAQILEMSVQPLLLDIATAIVDHDQALADVGEMLETSRLRPEHADVIRQALEGSRWLLERLKAAERDPSVLEKIDEVAGALLMADRVVTKAETDFEDDDEEGDAETDEPDGDAPEIPLDGSQPEASAP